MQLINGPECCYRATAINDHGDIVGYSARPTPSIVQTEAFVYLSGQLTDLGTLPDGALSWTNDINSQGQVVGTSDDGSGEFFGFIIDDPKQLSLRQMYSPDVYVSIRNAMGINEHGDVV